MLRTITFKVRTDRIAYPALDELSDEALANLLANLVRDNLEVLERAVNYGDTPMIVTTEER